MSLIDTWLRPYVCEFCGSSYPHRRALKMHRRKTHVDNSNNLQLDNTNVDLEKVVSFSSPYDEGIFPVDQSLQGDSGSSSDEKTISSVDCTIFCTSFQSKIGLQSENCCYLQCHSCSTTFKTFQCLSEHYKTMHSQNSENGDLSHCDAIVCQNKHSDAHNFSSVSVKDTEASTVQTSYQDSLVTSANGKEKFRTDAVSQQGPRFQQPSLVVGVSVLFPGGKKVDHKKGIQDVRPISNTENIKETKTDELCQGVESRTLKDKEDTRSVTVCQKHSDAHNFSSVSVKDTEASSVKTSYQDSLVTSANGKEKSRTDTVSQQGPCFQHPSLVVGVSALFPGGKRISDSDNLQ